MGGCERGRKGKRWEGGKGVMVDRLENENETNDCDGRGTTLARQQGSQGEEEKDGDVTIDGEIARD